MAELKKYKRRQKASRRVKGSSRRIVRTLKPIGRTGLKAGKLVGRVTVGVVEASADTAVRLVQPSDASDGAINVLPVAQTVAKETIHGAKESVATGASVGGTAIKGAAVGIKKKSDALKIRKEGEGAFSGRNERVHKGRMVRMKKAGRGIKKATRPVTGAARSATRIGSSVADMAAGGDPTLQAMKDTVKKTVSAAARVKRAAAWTVRSVGRLIRFIIRVIRRILSFFLSAGGAGLILFAGVVAAAVLAWAAAHPIKVGWRAFTTWFNDTFGSSGTTYALQSGASPNDSATPYTVMVDLNHAFENRIQEIKDTVEHDEESLIGQQCSWRDVFIVYGNIVGMDDDIDDEEDIVAMTENNIEILTDIFWEMNEIQYEIVENRDEVEVEVEKTVEVPVEDGEEGETEIKTVKEKETKVNVTKTLKITIVAMDARTYAQQAGWTGEEMEMVEEGLSAVNNALWLPVLMPGTSTSFTTGAGGFVWPVQGYTYLSTHFGDPDAIYGRPHRGIDIPAPQGTAIHAAADGTVIAAKWHHSWGNYVKIDHGGGVTTLYAHNSQLLVHVGQTVAAGDVISLCGSTGDSTGPHCHFEFAINERLQNPLNYVTP